MASTTVADTASAMTRPVASTPPFTINGVASGIKAPRMPALDANADVTAPDGAQQQRDHERVAETGDASAGGLDRAVALKRAHVGHDAADEKHDGPGDLSLGAGAGLRKGELKHGAGGQRRESNARPKPSEATATATIAASVHS